MKTEAGAKPRHLCEEDGGLRVRPRSKAAAEGDRTQKTLALGVTGPRIGQGEPDHRRSVRFLFARPQLVRGSRVYQAGLLVSDRPPLPRFRGDVAGWKRGAVS